MKPTIKMLQEEEAYTPLAKLPYSEMIPFVQHEFAQRNIIIRGYLWLNALIVILMVVVGAYQIAKGQITLWKVIGHTLLGFGLTLTALVPVHEALHGLAYKILGAPKVAFGGNLRRFYFYAVADQFVVNRCGFYLLALTPFVIISLIAIIGIGFSALSWQWIWWGILLMHTGACAGDFGMLGFYYRHGGGEIFTYDDVPNKVAYFFQKKSATAA